MEQKRVWRYVPRACTVRHASASPSRICSTRPASGSTPNRSARTLMSSIPPTTGANTTAARFSALTPALHGGVLLLLVGLHPFAFRPVLWPRRRCSALAGVGPGVAAASLVALVVSV